MDHNLNAKKTILLLVSKKNISIPLKQTTTMQLQMGQYSHVSFEVILVSLVITFI